MTLLCCIEVFLDLGLTLGTPGSHEESLMRRRLSVTAKLLFLELPVPPEVYDAQDQTVLIPHPY
jgi:hypothetical protein